MHVNAVINVIAVSLFNSTSSVCPALALSPKFTVTFSLVCVCEWLFGFVFTFAWCFFDCS
ncbi:membrane protein [methanotrophic bacterial endosymbiont of Bathymodiolus sp.]|nr:membrane protein [methanotrophic bacterial endosymbiont of Bathymodiolus sp.]